MNFKSSKSYEKLFMDVSHIVYKKGITKLSKIVEVITNKWLRFKLNLIQNKKLTTNTVNLVIKKWDLNSKNIIIHTIRGLRAHFT